MNKHRAACIAILSAYVAFGGVLSWSQDVARDAAHPLKAADTSSPRATLKSLISAVDDVYKSFRHEGRSFRSQAERRAVATQILRCLDLSDVSEAQRDQGFIGRDERSGE